MSFHETRGVFQIDGTLGSLGYSGSRTYKSCIAHADEGVLFCEVLHKYHSRTSKSSTKPATSETRNKTQKKSLLCYKSSSTSFLFFTGQVEEEGSSRWDHNSCRGYRCGVVSSSVVTEERWQGCCGRSLSVATAGHRNQVAEIQPLFAKWFRIRRQCDLSKPARDRNLAVLPFCR